jgi:glycosyltransferase involved in cell wall biosynthesis
MSSTVPTRVSVIVPAYNEERLLASSLHSIRAAMLAFDRAGWHSELIVCDNNSTDRTAEIAAAAGAKVVFEPVNQIARARNTGAAHASGDWLFFIDADSFPGEALMADAVEAIRGGRCLAGGSTIVFDEDARILRMGAAWWNRFSRLRTLAAGSFVFCEARAFRSVGGFDMGWYAAEELALFRSLKRLARREGRTVVILHRHPLRTSARKIHLYTPREILRLYVSMILTGGRSLRNAAACFAWYDGRR